MPQAMNEAGEGGLPSGTATGRSAMEKSVEIVEFTLAGGKYALDINLVREIVEMVPITPIPRAPPYISGVINLRGEITNIVNLNTHLKLPDNGVSDSQKIIVFTADTMKGNNVGIIVDTVTSVTRISESQIKLGKGSGDESAGNYVKGIISMGGDADTQQEKGLVIWLDILKLFKDIEKN